MIGQGLPGFIYKLLGLLIGMFLLAASFIANVKYGFTSVKGQEIMDAILRYDETSMNQVVIRLTRLPRALIASAIGASLAIAGVVMQAITRNPLASPSILGINSGAALLVVFAITILNIQSMEVLVWVAFAGAALGAVMVYALSAIGNDGLSPFRIVLAGAAISALFMSFTQGLLVLNQNALQDVLFWLTGTTRADLWSCLNPCFLMCCSVGSRLG